MEATGARAMPPTTTALHRFAASLCSLCLRSTQCAGTGYCAGQAALNDGLDCLPWTAGRPANDGPYGRLYFEGDGVGPADRAVCGRTPFGRRPSGRSLRV